MLIINVTELNETNYKGFISEGISLVDVWAPWCRPCKTISPIIDELSDEYREKVSFGKLNVDDNSEKDFFRELEVRNIPTIMIYKGGKIVERNTGDISKNKLKELIDKHL